MIVRCGRCQIELEVAGTGEFLCPSCGTRNVVRGAAGAPPVDPFGLPDLGGGLPRSEPPAPPAATDEPPPGIAWETCPACRFRFARGEVEEIACPSCEIRLRIGPEGATPVQEGSAPGQRN